MTDRRVTVFAPAMVSNVACGFDVLGFAIEHPGDEVTARFAERGVTGVTIDGITGDVTAKGHENWIHCNSLQWGVGRGIGAPTGSSKERESSEPSISPSMFGTGRSTEVSSAGS